MTRHADPLRGAISYEQWLRNRIARPAVICGPDIADPPSFWQDLFPFHKPAGIRQLEHQARHAELEAGS
jgi:hypothetical protein